MIRRKPDTAFLHGTKCEHIATFANQEVFHDRYRCSAHIGVRCPLGLCLFHHLVAAPKAMTQLTEAQLVAMALKVLEDAAAVAQHEQVRRSWGIRLALAFLVSRRSCERWPFDAFWKNMDDRHQQGRWANVNAALNGIYKQLGIRRAVAATSEFERDARKRLGRKGTEDRAERNWGGDKNRG